jgi:hypothetical protein
LPEKSASLASLSSSIHDDVAPLIALVSIYEALFNFHREAQRDEAIPHMVVFTHCEIASLRSQ